MVAMVRRACGVGVSIPSREEAKGAAAAGMVLVLELVPDRRAADRPLRTKARVPIILPARTDTVVAIGDAE